MKLLANFIVLSFCFLYITSSFAQGETSNWYFGRNAGLKFNRNGTVTPLTDGRLNTNEGCATISDPNGNLLFYTDGTSVWNRNHDVMPNGNSLYGNASSTQSAIIVPQPETPNIYYIFTIDTSLITDANDQNFGFNYSIVDMSLDNGNGDVTTKNVNLISRSSEKITAVVKDCFEGSIWVITFASRSGISPNLDTYYCYEVNSTGLISTPITSTFSFFNSNPNPELEGFDPRGYLKVSPDGTKVASANVREGLYIYDFDVSTGLFSNQQKIEINIPNEFPYGLEFSPNNRYLYVNSYNDVGIRVNDQITSSLIQFDLAASDIESSQVILDQQTDIYRGALQLAINGKIYRTLPVNYDVGSRYLGVINDPDLPGIASNYENNALHLDSRDAMQGLPPFIQSLFNKIDIINNNTAASSSNTSILNLCVGDSYTLTGEDIPGATYTWFKDGVVLPNTDYSFDLSNVTNEDVGFYELEIVKNSGDCPILGEALVTVFDPNRINNSTYIQCDTYENTEDGIAFFNLNNAYNLITDGQSNLTLTFYKDLNDFNNNIQISNPEAYVNVIPNESIMVVVSNDACSAPPVNLILTANPTIIVPAQNPNYFSCDEDLDDGILQAYFDFDIIETDFNSSPPTFYFTLEELSTETNPITGSHLLENNTTIYVKLGGANGLCEGVETFTLHVDEKPEAQLPDVIPFVCLNSADAPLSAPNGFDGYTWYYIDENSVETFVSNEQNLSIDKAGTYRLEVSYAYNDFNTPRTCSNSETFTVLPSNIATIIPEPEVNDISNYSQNNEIRVFTEGEGEYEFSLNNIEGPYQDSNYFNQVPAGFNTVYVRDKNGCGISSKEVAVIGYPKFFTPNNDGINDFWNINGISEFLEQNTTVFIFDRFGKLLTRIFPNTDGWNGTFNGQLLPSSDYWFTLELEDGRNFKGHFTLKR